MIITIRDPRFPSYTLWDAQQNVLKAHAAELAKDSELLLPLMRKCQRDWESGIHDPRYYQGGA